MSKGFHYTLEDSKIREYMTLSTKDKLKWLEEIFLFTEMALGEKEKEIRNKFREAKI